MAPAGARGSADPLATELGSVNEAGPAAGLPAQPSSRVGRIYMRLHCFERLPCAGDGHNVCKEARAGGEPGGGSWRASLEERPACFWLLRQLAGACCVVAAGDQLHVYPAHPSRQQGHSGLCCRDAADMDFSLPAR